MWWQGGIPCQAIPDLAIYEKQIFGGYLGIRPSGIQLMLKEELSNKDRFCKIIAAVTFIDT